MLWPIFGGFLLLLALIVVFPPVHSAMASPFSIVANFFGNFFAERPAEVIYNSQNMPLLQAPQSADPADATAIGGAALNFVDDSAILPVMGPMGSIADVDTYKLDQITTYTVHKGDSISEIAEMFGVSVNTIYWANNIKRGQAIKIGDVLVILPVTGIQYEIKKGDTAKKLAKKFKSDEGDIIAFNNLPLDGALTAGETIIIPDAEVTITSVSTGSTASPARLRGAGGPDLGVYFIRPILGGRRSQNLHGFNGIDLADSCGVPVYASAAGTVLVARESGWNGGYGQYVVISHSNGTQTLYSHLSQVAVYVGQQVVQGANIGLLGSSGNSTGCHVHFEVRGARNPF